MKTILTTVGSLLGRSKHPVAVTFGMLISIFIAFGPVEKLPVLLPTLNPEKYPNEKEGESKSKETKALST